MVKSSLEIVVPVSKAVVEPSPVASCTSTLRLSPIPPDPLLEIVWFDTLVILPCASTVICGEAVLEPYVPAVTAVSANFAAVTASSASFAVVIEPSATVEPPLEAHVIRPSTSTVIDASV